MAKKKHAPKRRQGRPKGAQNRDYEHVFSVEIPAECMKCGSTELRRIEGTPSETRDISGHLPSGQLYHKIIWRRCRCAGCGQFLKVRSYVCENNNQNRLSEAPASG